MSLATLITALYEHPEVRRRLEADPQEVFKEYRLSVEDVDVLQSHDMFLIANRAADDIRGMLIALARPETFGVALWNPKPPGVTGIIPQKTTTGVNTPVTVTGSDFAQGAQLLFQNPQTQLEVAATNVQVDPRG